MPSSQSLCTVQLIECDTDGPSQLSVELMSLVNFCLNNVDDYLKLCFCGIISLEHVLIGSIDYHLSA